MVLLNTIAASTASSTETENINQITPGIALAPPVKVDLKPTAPRPTKPQGQQPTNHQRHNWQQKARDFHPGELVPFDLRMIALRRTFGNGLASGQILIRSQWGWTFSKQFDFLVAAMFLPGADDRIKDGVIQDQTAWLPYDEGYQSNRDKFWDILEIKVDTDQAPFVRACDRLGNPYKGAAWEPMTLETVQLRMYKPEHLAAVMAFTGLEYSAWKHGENYRAPVLSDKDASVLAQRKRLS